MTLKAEKTAQSRSVSLASLVVEGEPAVLLAAKLSGNQVDDHDDNDHADNDRADGADDDDKGL